MAVEMNNQEQIMDEQEASRLLMGIVITVAVAAAILKVSENTVRTWVDEGKLDGYKVEHPGSRRKATYRVKSASVKKLLGIE